MGDPPVKSRPRPGLTAASVRVTCPAAPLLPNRYKALVTAGLAGLRKVRGPGGHGVRCPGQRGGGWDISRLWGPQPLQALVQVLCPEATAPCVFPRNAVTKYPGPGGLNHKQLISQAWRPESEIKALARWRPSEAVSEGWFVMTIFMFTWPSRSVWVWV